MNRISKEIKDLAEDSVFWDKIFIFEDWYKEIVDLRDPVAHRIPLYIPQVLKPDEEQEYSTLDCQQEELVPTRNNIAKKSIILDKMANIGTCTLLIVHDPEKAPKPLYPTLSVDMKNLIEITKIMIERLFHQ